jgi:hypothetical protein
VRNSIRKVLVESITNKPEWVDKFNLFSRDERIEFIQKYKQQVVRLTPKIIEFFKQRFGDQLKEISVREVETVYEYENYTGSRIVLHFYFDNPPFWELMTLKQEIWEALISYFNIDVGYYGVPLSIEFDS